MEDTGWTPVLSGGIYCSPRCGCGCTKSAFDKATADAATLADKLGPQWEPRVWENLGWHYDVRAGASIVMPSGSKYSAWINVDETGNYTDSLQFIETADTPEDALGFAVQKARGCILAIEQELTRVREPAHA